MFLCSATEFDCKIMEQKGDEPGTSGPTVRLTGITVDGTSVANFNPGLYEYTVPAPGKTSVTVVGSARSDHAVAYRQGSGSFATGLSSFTATVSDTPAELKVYRKSVGVNDSLGRTYKVHLTSGGTVPPTGTWRDYIDADSITVEEMAGSQPAFYIYYSKITMTIKPAYEGRIADIIVRGESDVHAVKQSDSPEVWVASGVLTGTLLTKDAVIASDSMIAVTLKGSPGETAWPEISSVTVNTTVRQPSVYVYISQVTVTVKPEYTDQIAAIAVKGVAAVKQSGSPETWIAADVVTAEELFADELVASDITVTPKGSSISREEVEIAGAWLNPPISRVTKANMSQPAVLLDMVGVRVYTNATVGSVTVKGETAVNQGGGVWLARLETDFDSFTLTPGQIVTDYTPPAGPGAAKLIDEIQIVYDANSPGYLCYVNVDRSESVNVKNGGIEITDSTTGALIASLADGKLTQSGTEAYQFGGVLEDPGSASLEGKRVTVKVTTASKIDEQVGIYGQTIKY